MRLNMPSDEAASLMSMRRCNPAKYAAARHVARRWPAFAIPVVRHFGWPVDKCANLLVAGAFAAILILAAGESNDRRLHDDFEQMRMACIGQGTATSTSNPLCDPMVPFWTNNPRHPYRGIQGRIADILGAAWLEHEWFARLAVAVLALSALPLACSCLLSQIRQLRAARAGRRGSEAAKRHSAG